MIKQDTYILYIGLLSTFYEKTLANHPNKNALLKKFQNFKQDALTQPKKSQDIDDDMKTVKTFYLNQQKKRQTSPSRQGNSKRLESILSEYNMFSFKQQNTFYRILAYSYIINILLNKQQKFIELLKEQTKTEGSSSVKKFNLIFQYLNRVINNNSVNNQTKVRLESLFIQDKAMLDKFIKYILIKRKPTLKTLIKDQYTISGDCLWQISEVLDIKLKIIDINDKNLIKREYGNGKMCILLGYDIKSMSYFHLQAKQGVSRDIRDIDIKFDQIAAEKSSILKNYLTGVNKNSDNINQLKSSKIKNFTKDISIKEKLKIYIKQK